MQPKFLVSSVLLIFPGSLAFSQTTLSQPQEVPRQLLSPGQLDALVAPIALYPDPLLSQALAASTYPLELVELEQWLPQHSDLRGSQLVEAAKQMNWDASVQAMVAFPEVVRMLTQNIRWTTDLGNAFLSQQAGVMDAIQRMRAQAQQGGRLGSTPQQVVTTEPGPARNAIAIQPADPQVIYVPAYNPNYVWGPASTGEYPALSYPSTDSGYFFSAAISIASFFTGLLSWSGWGWGLNWLTHGLFLNGLFFNQLGLGGGGTGFGGSYGAGYGGVTAWAHNPAHRLGVPYSGARLGGNRIAATPFRGGWQGFDGRPSNTFAARPAAQYRAPSDGWRSFGTRSGNEGAYRSEYRGMPSSTGFRGESRAYQPPVSGYRGSSPSHLSAMSAPARSFSREMNSAPHWSGGGQFKAPKSSGHFKAPKFSSHSSGHSSRGGHSGGHSKGGHRR